MTIFSYHTKAFLIVSSISHIFCLPFILSIVPSNIQKFSKFLRSNLFIFSTFCLFLPFWCHVQEVTIKHGGKAFKVVDPIYPHLCPLLLHLHSINKKDVECMNKKLDPVGRGQLKMEQRPNCKTIIQSYTILEENNSLVLALYQNTMLCSLNKF